MSQTQIKIELHGIDVVKLASLYTPTSPGMNAWTSMLINVGDWSPYFIPRNCQGFKAVPIGLIGNKRRPEIL